jgi:2-deoxy-D-gluconate 3-dehydrogenase
MGILDKFDLTGKKAIVTGGARGLSLGIAKALNEAGATVVLMDILDEVGESAKALNGRGGNASASGAT